MNNKNKMMRCVSSSDLIDAKLEEHQLCGSKQCPGCGHTFQPTTNPEWVGLPAGVKFDPTDQELIQHLEAKVESKTINNNNKSHPLIDEFIPTIEGDDGICYTHPDKLPGVRRDGLSRHFFHRPSKAYTTGTRKRRKIQNDECELQGETRWHKTGKTRPVMVGGKQRGCKKILVLYTNFGKNRKPEKTNWVMHQYHVGLHEEEKEGELVVSKIFYQTQPRQCSNYWPSSLENTTTAAAPQELINNNNGISSTRNNNSNSNSNDAISSSSSKEMLVTVTQSQRDDSRDEMCSFTTASLSDHFGFIPFRKPAFHDQVGVGEGSTAREEVEASAAAAAGGSCEQQVHHHHHQHNATTAFHMSRPSHPIISPPPLHHTTSIILDDHNDSSSYHLPTIMLQNHHHFQQQHHRKLGGGRSASGLEEIIMGCTSTHDHIKEASSSMTNAEEGEWLKYSSYWPDPAHHG